ncbi:conserved protein of unknown function [Methylacidimicrobium sp. AP8]|uniref:CAF17-like 4Fe-4S cluster assembly/insertion protein YgfZ n=1 Tax=Methylacidimicrobium sp. AP8 TaxID=2730359 RepID=UPI0018C14FB3|nr:folate-binding protein YgfZ [Methylacidimicrobium sp. AP8]CAB4242463.1 conserved protein of unknown function [Methylacidimicrobium sp. AP8]
MEPAALYNEILSGKPASIAVTDRTLWKATGEDRVRYINGQVTNDVASLTNGSAIYAALLTPKGRLVADLWIGATADALWIDGPTQEKEAVEARLRRFLAADDVELERLDCWTLIRAFPASPTFPLPPGAVALHSVRFGLPGWDLWCPDTGARQIGLPIPPALLESFRLEAGLPRWDAELHPGDLPQEVGMDPIAICYSKGCYVGQEIVSRLHHVGRPNRALVLLAASPPSADLAPNARLWLGEEEVGAITSAAHSFARKGTIALGVVKRRATAPGTRLRCDGYDLEVIEPLRPCHGR